MIANIDRDELKAKIEAAEPVVLLEVLPHDNYARKHLPGALHLPPDAVREVAPTLIPNRLTEVVLYGANETYEASKEAAELLDRIAYTTVRYYAGGKEDWVNAGLPTEPRS